MSPQPDRGVVVWRLVVPLDGSEGARLVAARRRKDRLRRSLLTARLLRR